MKMMNQNSWRVAILIVVCALAALAVHVVQISGPHVWFSAMFPGGEELQIVWRPSTNTLARLYGRGQLICRVAEAAPVDLVYGDYNVYERAKFGRQDCIAWDKSGDNRVPAFTINETVRGASWDFDNAGRFLGSN